jgi:hypothetical protein
MWKAFGHGSKRRAQLLDMDEIQERKGYVKCLDVQNNSQQTCHMQIVNLLCKKMMAWDIGFLRCWLVTMIRRV